MCNCEHERKALELRTKAGELQKFALRLSEVVKEHGIKATQAWEEVRAFELKHGLVYP